MRRTPRHDHRRRCRAARPRRRIARRAAAVCGNGDEASLASSMLNNRAPGMWPSRKSRRGSRFIAERYHDESSTRTRGSRRCSCSQVADTRWGVPCGKASRLSRPLPARSAFDRMIRVATHAATSLTCAPCKSPSIPAPPGGQWKPAMHAPTASSSMPCDRPASTAGPAAHRGARGGTGSSSFRAARRRAGRFPGLPPLPARAYGNTARRACASHHRRRGGHRTCRWPGSHPSWASVPPTCSAPSRGPTG